MDDFILKKGIQALEWESYYRKKKAADQSVVKHFLAPQTTIDPDFEKYFDQLKIVNGSLLDVGTGTGELAVLLAKKGFDVTATDVSPSAIQLAKEQAVQNVAVNFVVDNILLSGLTAQYDVIIDRGCFTLIPPKYKPDYLQQIKKLLRPGGWLFLKSDKKKDNSLQLFSADPDLKQYALEETSYQALGGKMVQAMFLATQKIK